LANNMNSKYIFAHSELERFSREAFIRAGFSREHADIIAMCLVYANLRGVDSHGVVRIPLYIEGIRRGDINTRPSLSIARETSFSLLIRGDRTLGFIPALEATRRAILKAREAGISVVGVIDIWHLGMLAIYTREAALSGLIGIAMANAAPNIGLHGFLEPVVGTNPISIAIPTGGRPIILDMALSIAARGKILLAAKRGERIPVGWALNNRGEDTTDPWEALEGMLLPIGLHKGFGLAMIIDIISGILLGGRYGLEIERVWYSQGGFFMLVMRPDLFVNYKEYLRRIEEYIFRVKSIPTASGRKILLPGEIEEDTMEKRMRDGIPLDSEVYQDLLRVAKDLGVDPPKPSNRV